MSLLPTPTILDQGTLAGAEAAHNFAVILKAQFDRFWQRDPSEVAAELNANPMRTVGIFQLNTQAGTAVNALLDSLNDPRFPTRAPVDMPVGWAFVDGQFTYTAPVSESDPVDEP
jgi:hypothetical protein